MAETDSLANDPLIKNKPVSPVDSSITDDRRVDNGVNDNKGFSKSDRALNKLNLGKLKTFSEKINWQRYLYYIGIILLVGALGFAGYKAYTKYFKEDSSETETQENTLGMSSETIKQKLEEAENAVAFKDYDTARGLLREIKEDVANLESNEENDSLKQKFEELLAKVDQIEQVVFESLTNLGSNPSVMTGGGMTIYNKKIYYVSENGIAVYDSAGEENAILDNEQTEYLGLNNISTGRLVTQISSSDGKEVFVYNTTNASSRAHSLESDDELASGVATTFNNYLYIPSADFTKLIKFTMSGANFSAGTVWTSDLLGIEIIDIAVDGSIYFLTSDGQITKYYQGEVDTDFVQTQLVENISADAKLYADSELENIYVLDKINSRVVVYNNEGELVKQYKSDDLSMAIDVYAYSLDDRLYVLTEKGVLYYDLEQSSGEEE